MASKYFTPADSAMGRVKRNQIVANNVTRMMRRMSPKLVEEENKIMLLQAKENRKKIEDLINKIEEEGSEFSNKKFWEVKKDITCCISHIDDTSITIKREHFYSSEKVGFKTFLHYKKLCESYHENFMMK